MPISGIAQSVAPFIPSSRSTDIAATLTKIFFPRMFFPEGGAIRAEDVLASAVGACSPSLFHARSITLHCGAADSFCSVRCGAWNTMSEFKEKPRFGGTRHEYISARRITADSCSRILIPETKAGSILESVNSTACSAAVLCVGHWFWSAARPALANRRCCCKCVRKCAKMPACSMFPGEESLKQIKIPCGTPAHFFFTRTVHPSETDMDQIINETELLEPDILIVDSIQTVYKRDLTAAPAVRPRSRNAR